MEDRLTFSIIPECFLDRTFLARVARYIEMREYRVSKISKRETFDKYIDARVGKRKYMMNLRKPTIVSSLLIMLTVLATPVALAQAIVATVSVGPGPAGIAANSVTNKIFVASSSSGRVTVIDGASNTQVASIGLGVTTNQIGLDPTTNLLYVSTQQASVIYLLDGSSYTVAGTIGLPCAFSAGTGIDAGAGAGVGVDVATNTIYVSCPTSDALVTIDGNTNTVTSMIPLSSCTVDPFGVAVNPTLNRIYIADLKSNNVMVIDSTTDTMLACISAGVANGHVGLDVNPNTDMVYVADSGSGGGNSLVVIDGVTNTVSSTIPSVGGFPYGVAVDSVRNTIYVTSQSGSRVSVINGATNSVVDMVPVPTPPGFEAANPSTNFIYVSEPLSDQVIVISGGSGISPTTTQVVCNPGTVAVNQVTMCTATVTDATSPTGAVSFSTSRSGTFSATSCTLASISSSASSCSVSYTANPGSEGTHVITGAYGGDPTHSASSGSFSLVVSQRTTSVNVSCSGGTRCTATVTDTSPGTPLTPTGTVTWSSTANGATFKPSSCTISGSGSTASCTVTYSPGSGPKSSQTITATYQGDTDHFGSSGTTTLFA